MEHLTEKQKWALGLVQSAQGSIALMNEVREQFPEDWEVEEITRFIIFEEQRFILAIQREVEDAAEARKGPEELQWGGPDHFIRRVDDGPEEFPGINSQGQIQYPIFR